MTAMSAWLLPGFSVGPLGTLTWAFTASDLARIAASSSFSFRKPACCGLSERRYSSAAAALAISRRTSAGAFSCGLRSM